MALLTGDNKTVGDYVANALDIDIVYSDLLPDQKVEKFNELIEKTKRNVVAPYMLVMVLMTHQLSAKLMLESRWEQLALMQQSR